MAIMECKSKAIIVLKREIEVTDGFLPEFYHSLN